MQIREGIHLALLQVRQERLKSAFSVLGVIIGVMFLVIVVSVVEGMDRYIKEDFSEQIYGINTVQVRRAPSVQVGGSGAQFREFARRPRPTLDEAERIRGVLSAPARVGVETRGSATLRTDAGRRVEGVQLSAISDQILEIRVLRVEEGRPFSPQEADRGVPVALLGRPVAEALFPDGDALGSRVRLSGFPYRVIGVLEDQGTLLGMSLDNRVLIPARSRAGRLLPERGAVGGIVVQAERAEDFDLIRSETEAALRIARGLRPLDPNNFELESADQSLAFWDRISTILFVALPGLVGISLVVGGIVIMNIMLMSVMERTREIGIRKALGARRKDIIGQFLVEAATLSGIGALLGVGIGIVVTLAIRAFTPLPAAVAPQWIVLGVVLGVSVGIAAGVYPAIRASAMDPVEALRYE